MKMVDEPLAAPNPKVMELVHAEERHQAEEIRLIPSQHHASRNVLAGSVRTNKHSEAFAGKRYWASSPVASRLPRDHREGTSA